MKAAVLLNTVITGVLGVASPYAQCGGQGWTGETTCTDGFTCSYASDWYSQCIPGTVAVTGTLQTSTTKKASTSTTTSAVKASVTSETSTTAPVATGGSSSGRLRWLGVDESVAEFGQGNYPGVYGQHFFFPDESAIAVGSCT